METNRVSRGFFSLFGIFALSIMFFACEPGKKTASTGGEPISESVTPGTESAEAMDTRINDLNQEFSSLQRELMASETVTDEDFRQEWRSLEVKRHELNRKIELYNEAVENDANLEASEIRTDINRMIQEIQSDLKSIREEYGSGIEQQQQPGEEEPFGQEQ